MNIQSRGIPVAVIRSKGSGPHHCKEGKQCAQIPLVNWLAVGCSVMLTKSHGVF